MSLVSISFLFFLLPHQIIHFFDDFFTHMLGYCLSQ